VGQNAHAAANAASPPAANENDGVSAAVEGWCGRGVGVALAVAMV